MRDKPNDVAGYAVELAFGRLPTAKEKTLLTAFLRTQTERQTAGGAGAAGPRRAVADLCHMLLCAGEFAYVD